MSTARETTGKRPAAVNTKDTSRCWSAGKLREKKNFHLWFMDVLHAVENGDLIKKRSGTFDLWMGLRESVPELSDET